MTHHMHCLVYHVPDHMRQYANLLMFSGQGELGESAKRKYNKHNATYWYGGGIEADRASHQKGILLNKHVIIPG